MRDQLNLTLKLKKNSKLSNYEKILLSRLLKRYMESEDNEALNRIFYIILNYADDYKVQRCVNITHIAYAKYLKAKAKYESSQKLIEKFPSKDLNSDMKSYSDLTIRMKTRYEYLSRNLFNYALRILRLLNYEIDTLDLDLIEDSKEDKNDTKRDD